MKNILIAFAVCLQLTTYGLLLSSCGGPDIPFLPSLSARQPRVIEITPPSDSKAVSADGQISVLFSEAIDPTTVDKYSFFVVENAPDEPFKELESKIDKGDLEGIDGSYLPSEDGKASKFTSTNELKSGTDYSIILTDRILTVDKLPLAPFISRFGVAENNLIIQEDNEGVSQTTLNEAFGEDGAPAVDVFVAINEIFYDAIGSDTDGSVFIELFGDAGASIGGYKIVMVNGDDGKITGTLELPIGAKTGEDGFYVAADSKTGSTTQTNVADADFIINFDPQNGPDAVQLTGNNGELVDAVCYGEVPIATAENGLDMCLNHAPDAASGQSISRIDGADEFVINATPSPSSPDVQEEATQ